MAFSQFFSAVSAYKDPVENQHMIKILDQMVTGFFVVVFGALWYFSAKYYVKPNQYSVIIYDVFGKQVELKEVRTDFKTHEVARSYITEYQKRFPHYNFSMKLEMPEIRRSSLLRILRNNQR